MLFVLLFKLVYTQSSKDLFFGSDDPAKTGKHHSLLYAEVHPWYTPGRQERGYRKEEERATPPAKEMESVFHMIH